MQAVPPLAVFGVVLGRGALVWSVSRESDEPPEPPNALESLCVPPVLLCAADVFDSPPAVVYSAVVVDELLIAPPSLTPSAVLPSAALPPLVESAVTRAAVPPIDGVAMEAIALPAVGGNRTMELEEAALPPCGASDVAEPPVLRRSDECGAVCCPPAECDGSIGVD